MNVPDLIGRVVTLYLQDELADDRSGDRGSAEGTARYIIDCLTAEQTAAIARSFPWISRHALRTALPMRTVDLDAEVCWSYGTTAVSPITTVTQSSGAPSSWLASCANTVRAPWPMSDVPAYTMTEPSARSRTIDVDKPVVGPDLIPTAIRLRS